MQTPALPRGEIISAGIDYLTVTWSQPRAASQAFATGLRLVEAQEAKGNDGRAWLFFGYRGRTAGQASVGLRAEGALIRLSGQLANEHWLAIHGAGGRSSRLDLQVTVRFKKRLLDLAQLGYCQADAHNSTVAKPLKLSLVRDNQDGSTLYLGSRTSQRFARLYNKEAESKEVQYERSWRYEVEYKAELARVALGQLAASRAPVVAIINTVHGYFCEHGVPPAWRPTGDGLHLVTPHTQSDDERRLAWLNTQVRPVIEKLLARHSPRGLLTQLGLSLSDSP